MYMHVVLHGCTCIVACMCMYYMCMYMYCSCMYMYYMCMYMYCSCMYMYYMCTYIMFVGMTGSVSSFYMKETLKDPKKVDIRPEMLEVSMCIMDVCMHMYVCLCGGGEREKEGEARTLCMHVQMFC